MELNICEGCCYQVFDRLLDVTTPATASMLKKLASSRGAIEVSRDHVFKRGFEELANWAITESDRLYVIDDFVLVCLPQNGGAYT